MSDVTISHEGYNNNNIMTSIAPVSLNNIETQWRCEYTIQ